LIPIFEPFFGTNEKKNLLDCIDSGWISSQGKFIVDFEDEFSKFHSMSYGVATSNCTWYWLWR
jgi:perosamine synthetase